ncbi:MAG: 50S ribosomal protein L15 [Smithellaceae bacterium]|nr:50S ribosomal protein L15 [Smithellaceae bacterium]
MKLDELKPPAGSRKNRKRVGRGGAHGGTSCRGAKGQRARSGGNVRDGFEGGQMPLARRLPKRGFRNPFRKEIAVVNIEQLKKFPAGSTVDAEALVSLGVVGSKGDGIKLLAKGEIGYPLTLKVNMASAAARRKIEAAGGTIEEVA